VRALALRRLSSGLVEDGEIDLLRKNYEASDWRNVLVPFCRLPRGAGARQCFLRSVLDIFTEVASADSRDPLLVVYERIPCSHCRQEALETLAKLGAAPAWVVDEALHDCQPEVRSLAAGLG
jgi:hypothetical protein